MVFIGYKLYKPTTIGFSDGNKYDVVIWCDVIIGAIVVFIGYKPTTVGIWWWSGCLEHDWIMTFHSVENVIIPTDELIFFRGVVLPPTRFLIFWHTSKIQYPSFLCGISALRLLGYWPLAILGMIFLPSRKIAVKSVGARQFGTPKAWSSLFYWSIMSFGVFPW